MGTVDNGVVIAPIADVPIWTNIEDVLGPPARAFSFAIVGACGLPETLEVPALDRPALVIFGVVLALAAATVIARRAA